MRRRSSSRGVATAVAALVGVLSVPGHEASAQPFGGRSAPWTRSPSIVVVSAEPNASHLPKVHAAVAFWNRELAAMGSPFRLGPVTQVASQSGWSDYQRRPGSIVVVFSTGGGGISNAGGARVSNAERRPDQGAVVHLRIGDSLILAHELGHAIGLRHSTIRESLMYGAVGFGGLRLTAKDKAILLALSPSPGAPVTATRRWRLPSRRKRMRGKPCAQVHRHEMLRLRLPLLFACLR
jgi:hypothetical protein